VTSTALSVAGWVPRPALGHVSPGPPAIPDGRISRVRFWPGLSPRRLPTGAGALPADPEHAPDGRGLLAKLVPTLRATARLARSLGPARSRPGPRAPSLGWRYPPVVATTGPCASPPPSRRFLELCGGSVQVAVSPCCAGDLPDVISAGLSPGAWTPTPAVPAVPVLVTSRGASAFPPFGRGRHATGPVQRLRYGTDLGAVVMRCGSGLRFCLPSRSLPPQGPRRAPGRPGR
jgi:hypothetical protein